MATMKKKTAIMIGLLFMTAGFVGAVEVPINPITPDIREKVRESTELVGQVEDTMAPKVADLEKIYKTYMETCDGAEGDRGCVEIQNQIREKYRDVLETMAEDLPKVRASIDSTAADLGRSIKSKTRNRSLQEIYADLGKKGTPPKVRGPLSKKLSELLRALGPAGLNVSILELSLQTQSDLIAASEILNYVEAKVNSQKILLDVTQDFGVVSPEMANVMRGVADLFGYDVDFEAGIEPEGEQVAKDDWRS
jgi:hypothetical protein